MLSKGLRILRKNWTENLTVKNSNTQKTVYLSQSLISQEFHEPKNEKKNAIFLSLSQSLISQKTKKKRYLFKHESEPYKPKNEKKTLSF